MLWIEINSGSRGTQPLTSTTPALQCPCRGVQSASHSIPHQLSRPMWRPTNHCKPQPIQRPIFYWGSTVSKANNRKWPQPLQPPSAFPPGLLTHLEGYNLPQAPHSGSCRGTITAANLRAPQIPTRAWRGWDGTCRGCVPLHWPGGGACGGTARFAGAIFNESG